MPDQTPTPTTPRPTLAQRINAWWVRRQYIRRWRSLTPENQMAVFLKCIDEVPAVREQWQRALRVKGFDPDGREQEVAMVTCAVTLRDSVTGRSARVEEQFESADTASFWWLDGNGACDCERLRQLWAACGEPDPNIPCSDERVEIIAATIDCVAVEGWS